MYLNCLIQSVISQLEDRKKKSLNAYEHLSMLSEACIIIKVAFSFVGTFPIASLLDALVGS